MAGTTQRVAAFVTLLLSQVLCANPGDFDSDGDRDLRDFSELATCLAGPGVTAALGCTIFDTDGDLDVDLPDFSMFQISFTGSLPGLTTLVAEYGTPADPFLASVNVGQEMLIKGEGLTAESDVIFPVRNHLGVSGQLSVAVEPFTKDGTLGRVIVPPEAETGTVTLPDDKQLVVQIVPHVTGITGGRGRATTLIGTGFIEGLTTVTFGAVPVVDGGPGIDDGIDVFSVNTRAAVTVPPGGAAPVTATTPGGISNVASP